MSSKFIMSVGGTKKVNYICWKEVPHKEGTDTKRKRSLSDNLSHSAKNAKNLFPTIYLNNAKLII